MHGSDVMLNVGARFDDRVTGRLNAFSPNAKKIHIDIDPSSINKNVRVDLPVVGDAGRVLQALISAWREDETRHDTQALAGWGGQSRAWGAKRCLRFSQDAKPGSVIKPQYAVQRLYEITRELGRE